MKEQDFYQTGVRVSVFDAKAWSKAGYDDGDNSQFWRPATIRRRYWNLVDVEFDHEPGQISAGHFVSGLRQAEEMTK